MDWIHLTIAFIKFTFEVNEYYPNWFEIENIQNIYLKWIFLFICSMNTVLIQCPKIIKMKKIFVYRKKYYSFIYKVYNKCDCNSDLDSIPSNEVLTLNGFHQKKKSKNKKENSLPMLIRLKSCFRYKVQSKFETWIALTHISTKKKKQMITFSIEGWTTIINYYKL